MKRSLGSYFVMKARSHRMKPLILNASFLCESNLVFPIPRNLLENPVLYLIGYARLNLP